MSRRDRNTTVYLNADGTSTVVFSSLPVHFPAGDGSWQKIDNRVVVGPDGRLTNGANEWSVTFEPMVSGGGLRFSTPDGEFGFHAAGAALVEPEIEPDGESVRYRNVFPATDLVYRLNGAGVEELLILKSRNAQSVVRFVVDGAQFDQVAGGLEGRGLYEGKLRLSNPETFTADGRPIDPGDHVFGVENGSGGDAVVELGVRSDRVDRMPAEAFPLVVDPTMEYVQNPAQTVKSYGHYVSGGGEFGDYADGYARTGNPYLSSTSTARWRSVVYVPYESVNISNPQASIVDANVLMRYSCCSGSGTQNVFAHWADQWDFHYDKQVRRHTANASGVPSVTSFTRTTWPGGSYAEGSLGTINNWMQPSDLRSIYHAALRQSSSGLALLLSGDEGFTYTYKKFAVDVRLTYNRWPNSPGLTKSSSGRTVTWGASAAVSDPDGDTVQYMPQIWEYTSSGWVLRKTYSWSTTDTRTYTAPASWRGTTMYLRVGVWDSTADIHGETHQRWTADTAYPWVVGNLVPSAGTLLLPANGYTVHPTPVDSPVLTFTGTVGTDPAPENDPVSYRFFVCSTASCSGGRQWVNNTRTPAAGGATVSESVNFVTDPDLDPKYNVTQYWGIETWDGYSSSYSSTRSFKLTNAAPPAATAMSPDMSWVTTNQPTLTVDAVTDSDGDPVTYKFRVCSQQVWTSDTSKCVESGFQTTRSWTVPSNSPLVWSTTNYWWVVTSDGAAQTESGTQASIVPQRTPASHPQLGFGVQPNMRPVAGVNTATGNLTYTADDLEVASSSQPLVFQRIYNSASDRPGGFGVGWTHSWDYRLETDTQGATVYGPDGDGMFFGQNPDGTYAMEFANGSELAQSPTGVPAPISAVGAAGWQLTTSDKTRIYFTPAGAFLGLVDSVGRTVTRTTSGNIQTLTDVESGRTLHLEWDATPDAAGSRIIAVRTAPVTPAGGGTAVPIEWHYFYDAAGQLDQACDPRDNRKDLGTCYSFDWIGGLLQRVVLPKGNTQIALTYDAQDRVGTRTDGEGNTWTYEYATDVTFQTLPDPNNNNQVYTVVAPYQTTVTNPRNFQDEFFYDTAMRLVYVDRLDDSAEHIEYDFNSWATKMSFDDTTTTAPSGTSTYAFENEPDGDVTVLVEPTGETTTASYSTTTNALESITAPGGIQTTVTVNTAGQPQTIATPGEGTITVDYTTGTEPVVGQPGVVQPPGLPKEHTGLDGVTSQMSYNEFGDLVQVTTSTGLTTTFTHDEIGRVITETSTWNGQSAVRTVTYDELGQTTTVTDPRVQNMVSGQWHQARTTWVYDDNTNPESISIADIEPAANGFVPDPARQVSAEYDDNDRAWRLVDPEGNVSSVEFDHGENITRLVDVNGNVTVTAYDSEDRPITVTMLDVVDPTDPNAPARDVVLATMTYDQFSRLRTRTDALGRTVQYDYDPAGRLWKSTLLDFDRRDGAIVDVVLEEFGHDPTTGLLMWSEQANGQTRVDYGYDTSHRLATTTLRNTVSGFVSRDRTTTYGYDGGSMRIASQIISDGNGSSYETRWAYDSEGRLVSETVEDGLSDSTTSYIYGDSRSLDTGVTDPEQHTTTTDYDVLGRPWKRTNPAETVVAYGAAAQVEATFGITGYNTFGEPTHYQDADGNITETSYDGNGRPTVMTFPEYTPAGSSTPIAPTTVNEYDPAGNIERQTDRRGVVTDLEYDAFNRLTTMLAPPAVAGGPRAESLYRYDDVGNLTWARNAIGAELSKTYDDLNRVRSATQHVRRDAAPTDLLTSTYDYDWAGNQILAIDAAGTTVATAVFSPAGDRLAVTDALGYTTSTEYNALGQPLEQVDPAGNATVHTYRANGWLQSRQRFDATGAAVAGTLATFTYDLNGNLTSALRPDGRGPSYEYDDLNRLTRVTEPVDALTSNVTEYGYDARGLLSLVVDGRQDEWWTTYTPWATVESRIEPATSAHPNLADRTFTNIYEPGGNIARVDQPGGVSITRTFDQLGQVVAETGGSAGGDRGYGYDLLGRVTTVTSGATSVTVGYDDRNLLTAVTGTSGDSTFAYDAAGRMERRTDAAGVHLYDWTVRGELDHVADPLTGSTRDYTWSPDGTLDRYTVTTGTSVVTRDFAWDAAQRIVADVLTDDQSQVTRSVSYGYDANGNLDQRITAPAGLAGAGQDLYSYDWSNRLTAWTAPNATVTDYAYDPAGNLVGNGSVVNVYDERNRLLTSGGTSNSWTARGTLASSTDASGTTTYSHDGLGRLTAAGSIGYTFDGFDRIASRDGTPFVYSGLSSQPTSDGSSVVSRDPSGAIVSYSQGGQAVGVVTDRHRDVVATFDATGAIVDSLAFDPWGATLATVGVNDVRWGFQSSYTDPVSNLVSMGARWYDTAGSFVSRDTWSGRAQAPVTLNRYAYANNDPIGFYDPTGRCGLMVNVDGLGCGFSFKDRTYFTPTKYHSPTSSHITSRAKAARPAPPPPPAQPKFPKSFYAANDVLPKPPTPLAPTFNRSFLAANEVLPKVNASTVDDAGHRSNALMAQPRPVGEDRTSSGPTVPARLRDSSACSLPLSLLCANTVPRFPGDGSGLDIVDGKLNGIYQFVIIGSFERSDLHLAEQWKMLVDIGGFSFSGGDATRYTTFEEGTIYLVYNRRTAATETEPSILAAWSGSIDVWDEGTFSTLTWSKSGPDPTSGYGLPIATETDIANRFVRLNDGAGTLIPETIPFDTSGLPFGDAGRIPGLVVGRLR